MPCRLLTLLALALTCAPAFAQGEPTPAPGARPAAVGFGSGRLSLFHLPPAFEERLKLTPDQKKKLGEIETRVRQESPVQAGSQLTREQRRAGFQKLQALQRRADGEAEALLTPEQKKQWELLRSDSELVQGLGRYGRPLLSLSDLTDAQRTRLRELTAQVQQQRARTFQAVQANDPQARQQVSTQLRALDQEVLKALRGILTPAQFQLVDPAAAGRGTRRLPNP